MPDLTPFLSEILKRHNACPNLSPRQRLDAKDDFLKEAYQIVLPTPPFPPLPVGLDAQSLDSAMLTTCSSRIFRTPTSPLSTDISYPFGGPTSLPLLHPVVPPPQTLPTQRSPTPNATSSTPRPNLCCTRSPARSSNSRRLRACGRTRNDSSWSASGGARCGDGRTETAVESGKGRKKSRTEDCGQRARGGRVCFGI